MQRAQPEAIVSQLISALNQPPQSFGGPSEIHMNQTSPLSDSSPTVTESRASARDDSSSLHEWLHLGFATVTGLVRVHTRRKEENYWTINSEETRFLRVQVQMPTWLSVSVLDAVFSRSYAGWTCSLKMYGHIPHGSTEFRLVFDVVRDDNVDGIHRLFQERRCNPLDRLMWPKGGYEMSLMTVSWLVLSVAHLAITHD